MKCTWTHPLLLFSGAVNLPSVAVGMLLGGVIMKKVGLSLKTIPRFSVVMLTMSTILCIPLFFLGCPTQRVSEVNLFQNGEYGSVEATLQLGFTDLNVNIDTVTKSP